MTTRDAILLAVPVFAAHGKGGLYAVRGRLERAGIPAALAAEIVEFLPIAVARAMLDGMGVRFEDYYIRQNSQGEVIGEKLLMDEPVYREGLALADEISGMADDSFMAVAGWSTEYRAINKALNAGSRSEDLRCPPPVILAQGGDQRTFDDTSAGPRPQKKSWWQFWG